MRDVRMIQRSKHLRFTSKARDRSGSSTNAAGRTLSATSRSSLRRGPVDLSHAASADRGDDLVRTDAAAAVEHHARRSDAIIAEHISANDQIAGQLPKGQTVRTSMRVLSGRLKTNGRIGGSRCVSSLYAIVSGAHCSRFVRGSAEGCGQ